MSFLDVLRGYPQEQLHKRTSSGTTVSYESKNIQKKLRMLNPNNLTDDEEEKEDDSKGLADDVLEAIDDGIVDEELDPLAVPEDDEEDEEHVAFDKHDDVDLI